MRNEHEKSLGRVHKGRGGAAKPYRNEHDPMIPRVTRSVKSKRANWLKDFHTRNGLKSTEMVELIRSLCPGFDKQLLSKAENPEKYGVQLSQRVIKRLKEWEETHHDA